jgi:hypothetical protein
MNIGEKVIYKKRSWNSQYGGHHEGEIKEGIIEEIFDSQDKSFKCMWIKNESELITEYQIIR